MDWIPQIPEGDRTQDLEDNWQDFRQEVDEDD
jgi:hypothetical protein